MPDKSGFLTESEFITACSYLPVVCIDFVITRQGDKGLEVLLGLRNNTPAKGYLFTPGGRIRKGETLKEAMTRIANGELGIKSLGNATLLGVWDHFFDEGPLNTKMMLHNIDLAYHLNVSEKELNLNQSQHEEWVWMTIKDAMNSSLVHEDSKPQLNKLAEMVNV